MFPLRSASELKRFFKSDKSLPPSLLIYQVELAHESAEWAEQSPSPRKNAWAAISESPIRSAAASAVMRRTSSATAAGNSSGSRVAGAGPAAAAQQQPPPPPTWA